LLWGGSGIQARVAGKATLAGPFGPARRCRVDTGWQYEETRSVAPLAGHVAAFWQMRGGTPLGPDAAHRILPDGCMDVVFRLGRFPAILVAGTMTQAIAGPLVPGMDTFGIRFRPGGAQPWLNVPADDLTDTHADPRDCALRPPSWLTDALITKTSLDARAQCASAWLIGSARGVGQHGAVYAAARMLTRAGQSVSAAARELGMSERTLQRSFQRSVGLAPAEYRRVARLRRLLGRLDTGVSLADAAVDAGYYDQPHLDREFRRLVGCAPRQWLATRVGFEQDAAVQCL
jgi:AraC-like DNA-binding protein